MVFAIAVVIPVTVAIVSEDRIANFDPTPLSTTLGVWIAAGFIPVARRRDAVAALRQANAFIQSTDPIILADTKLRIVDYNLAASRLLPPGARLTGKSLHGIWPALVEQVSQSHQTSEFRIGDRAFDVVAERKQGESGDTNYIITLRDVTKRTEAETLRIRDIERKAIIDRNEGFALITGGIAHEFNNAVMAIIGLAELIEDEKAGSIVNQAKRISGIVDQLTTSTQQSFIPSAPVNVLSVVGETMRTLGSEGTLDNVHVDISAEPGLPEVVTNKSMISEAVKALSQNALEAMPDGGSIKISANTVFLNQHIPQRPGPIYNGNFVNISITDTGVGMDQETLTRAIDPFFTTKERALNKGLGLSQAFGLVRICGGDLSIQSTPGVGTTITIYLKADNKPA